MATIERYTGTSWVEIDHSAWEVTNTIHPVSVAPTATIESHADETVGANDEIRILVDGTQIFGGYAQSGGNYGATGERRIPANGYGHDLLSEKVDVTLTDTTDFAVIDDALSSSDRGGQFTLSHAPSNVSIGDYEVDSRSLSRIFADMMDITGYIYWIDEDRTIHVEEKGGRLTWTSIDTSTDSAAVRSWDSGNVQTVQNDITVHGTGEVEVIGTAEDAASISEYGKRSAEYNYKYITSQTQADDMASSLIVPEPLGGGTVIIGADEGDVHQNLVNYELDLTDSSRDISGTYLITKQIVRENHTELKIGEKTASALDRADRGSMSTGDITTPGSVYGGDRIADASIDTAELADRAVDGQKVKLSGIIAENIADSAVERAKIAQAAINESKIEAGTIGATRLFVYDWIPIGLTLTDNDPNAGDISWNSHSLVFEGTEYSISSGSTSNKYVYWLEGNTSYSTAADGNKPDLGANDAMVAINEGGTAREILQATEIHGGAIRTGTIEAAEIKSGVITADLIDTLDLDTSQLFIGTDAATGFEFAVDSTNDWVKMLPSDNGAFCVIGEDGKEISSIWTEALRALNVVLAGKTTLTNASSAAEFKPDGTTNEIHIREDGGEAMISPESDNVSAVGDPVVAFREMNAHNFVTASPDKIDGVELDELEKTDWYDNPPEEVKNRAKKIGTSKKAKPEGMDHVPVELGTMSNYLLEAVKELSRERSRLQDRVDDLESRLKSVESELN